MVSADLTKRAAWLASTALVLTLAGMPDAAMAQDATWLLNPGSLDFNTATNWSPATVPTGTAFFGTSNTTTLTFSSSTTIGGWTFNAGASDYTINNSLVLSFTGAGIDVQGGSVYLRNYNTVNFYNASTAGAATIQVDAASNVNFYNTSTAGSSEINLGGGLANTLTFNNSSTAGHATVNGYSGGTLVVFKDTSTAGSATLRTNSYMEFRDASTAGDASIQVAGLLQFFDTSSAGSAKLTAQSGGTIDFSTLTSTGTTAGSIEGAGLFKLGSKTLDVGSNNLDGMVSGIIEGNGGTLIKTGTGTLRLTGTSNSYTGATMVNGGTLRVDGSIATSSDVTVNNNARLSGSGTVSNTTINNGGTLAAGNGTPGSSLNVAGSLALQSGAFYMVQLNPTTSSFTSVTGKAELGGATVKASYANGSYVAKQYTILTAGSIVGTFGAVVDTNTPSNFHSTLSYDATHAYINLTLNFAPPGGNLNGNQNAVGNAVINSFNSNGGISLVYSGLTPNGLTQASGEIATGSQQSTFNAMSQFMGVMTDPFAPGRSNGVNAPAYANEDAASAYASSGKPRSRSERDAYAAIYSKAPMRSNYDPRWSAWAAGFGGSQTTDGNIAAGTNNSTSSLFGVAAGADYFFSPNTVAGFALAGGGTNFSVVNSGSGRSDLFQAGAFVRHTAGQAYVTGALAYGWQDISTDRTVTIAGVDRLRAQFNANAFSGRVEGGYRFITPWMGGVGITPYAAAQFTTFDLPAYAEQVVSGSNAFALAYGAKSVTATRSELGLRADKSFAMQSAILILRGRAAWAHDFNPDRAIGATFQALPGASFVVNGARQASDSALTTASAELNWMNGWSAAGTFEGEFSNVTRSYAGKGTVRYTW